MRAERIKASGLFDAEWYSERYPDVAAVGIDPIEHYLRWGWRLGRSPCARFDARRYIESNGLHLEEVDPLIHFLDRWDTGGEQAEQLERRSAISSALPNRSARSKAPLTALVIAWDVGHNPLGRAYMLAEVLERIVRNVVLIGFQFPRFGRAIWEPVRRAGFPIVTLPTADLPGILAIWERIAANFAPDIVFACKPRLPSLQLAAMIRQRARCPVVLDVDDHELSFFDAATPMSPSSLSRVESSSDESPQPYERVWTQVAHGLMGSADQMVVSNTALQREFGGAIVPHVRDETAFDPALYEPSECRARFGIPPSAKVVLFLGTARAHKGLEALARAVGSIKDSSYRLVVVGAIADKRVIDHLHEMSSGRLILIPNQPFSKIPEILSCSNVVCLPQDPSSPISRYQLPAKAIDAIAMGVPLLVTPTESMRSLISEGLATPVDPRRLTEAIVSAAEDRRTEHTKRKQRELYLSKYSYGAAAETLHTIIKRARARRLPEKDEQLEELLRQQRRIFGTSDGAGNAERSTGKDVVLFWKQNDTTLYGRRHDMVISYLASRADIRKVVVFDAPMSESELAFRRTRVNEPTQDALIYVRTYQKLAGFFDTNKISFNVFVYAPSRDGEMGAARPGPSGDAYLAFVARTLESRNVRADSAIFWFYPQITHALALIERFKPEQVVVDVVDDHRAWPDVSEDEHLRLTSHYAELLGAASAVFANCPPVVEAMSSYHPDIKLVPNGCDDRIRVDPPEGDPNFDELRAFDGKIIGFVGNVEKKLDLELLEKIAGRFPDCLIVLIGSTHANPDALRLLRFPNVRMPGVVPYDVVGAWIAEFDVGIIPHVDSQLTRHMNPLKQYVYLALGVPVVCTDIANVDRSHGAVRVAVTHEAFLQEVADVLDARCDRIDGAAMFIGENSWKQRFEKHVDLLLSR